MFTFSFAIIFKFEMKLFLPIDECGSWLCCHEPFSIIKDSLHSFMWHFQNMFYSYSLFVRNIQSFIIKNNPSLLFKRNVHYICIEILIENVKCRIQMEVTKTLYILENLGRNGMFLHCWFNLIVIACTPWSFITGQPW